MTPIAAVAGMLLTAGVLAVVMGARRIWSREPSTAARVPISARWARLTRRPPGAAGRRRDLVLVGSIAVGLGLAVATGWTLLLVLVPLAALGLPVLLRLPQQRDVAVMEALDRWLRSLAATHSGGSPTSSIHRTPMRWSPP